AARPAAGELADPARAPRRVGLGAHRLRRRAHERRAVRDHEGQEHLRPHGAPGDREIGRTRPSDNSAVGEIREPEPVLPIVALLARDEAALEAARGAAARVMGPLELLSPVFPFEWTSYYEAEMGPGLL